ncbi:MAG: hypothetical protein ABFE07_09720 [Armatimonadia bacterium]
MAADMYWQSPKEVWNRERDYPPMRLPYPTMWIEWDNPRQWKSGRKTVTMTHGFEFGMQLGMLLREHEAPESRISYMSGPSFNLWDGTGLRQSQEPLKVVYPKNCSHVFEVSPYAMREGKANLFPFTGLVFTDKHGNQLKEIEWAGPMGEAAQRTIEILSHITPPALLAVGLMNCKNVTTDEREVAIGRNGRRHAHRTTKYHTIIVPGHDSHGGQSEPGESKVAMHRVRGHFKTFTAERPLMGKFTGTYWWGWQVRGSKKNGVVVSDYKVGV